MTADLVLLVPINPADVLAWPGWVDGPLPVNAPEVGEEVALRSSYFSTSTAALLYDLPHGATVGMRKHRRVEHELGNLRVTAVEVVGATAASTILAVHAEQDCPLDDVLPAAVDRSMAGSTPLDLLISQVCPEGVQRRVVFRRHRRISYLPLLPDHGRAGEVFDDVPDSQVATSAWRLGANVAAPDVSRSLPMADRGDLLPLSASWLAWVLRDALSCAALRAEEDDAFLATARRLTRSIYLDTLMAMEIRELELSGLQSAVAEAEAQGTGAMDLEVVEDRVSTFRTRIWRQRVSHHAVANRMCDSIAAQRGLHAGYDELIADLGEVSRRARTHLELQSTSALAVIATVGVPLSVALPLVQMVTDGWLAVGISLLVGTALAAALLVAPQLRPLLRGLRGAPRRPVPRR